MLSNREIQALDRYSAAYEDFKKATASGAGKEMRAERLALEKAAGGKKKLDHADAVLADAKRAHDDMVMEARRKAINLGNAAEARTDLARNELVIREGKAFDLQASLDALGASLDVKSRELEEAEVARKKRAGEANARDIEIDKRETVVVARENAVASREDRVEARARRMAEAAA